MNTVTRCQNQVLFALVGLLAWVPFATAQDSGHALQMKCAKSSTYFHEIKINNGVRTEKAVVSAPVATFRIPVTRNSDEYVNCLETHRENPRVAKMAYFDELNRCRRETAAPPTITISTKDLQLELAGQSGKAELDRCLRGVDGEIEVELVTD